MSRLRVVIVGCGKIADQHVWAIGRIPFAEVVGVCDREPLMAEQLAERSGVGRWSADLGDLLAETRPDVVHITTPPQSHLGLARQCLEAGCHVYVEKPFTLHTADARHLIDLAVERNLKITAGHNAQFTWETLQARALVDEGFLGGPPVHIESYYTYNIGDARYAKALLGDRNHWVRHLPGKLLHNIVSHGVARIAAFMTCDVPQVAAFGHASPTFVEAGEADVIDELRAHVWDGGNVTASFVFSTQLGPPVNGFRLYGRRHSLVVDNVHHTIVRLESRGYKSYANYVIPPLLTAREYLRASMRNVARFVRTDFHDDSGMKNLVEAFYRAVLGEGPLPFGHDELLRVSRIMDGIFAELAARRTETPGRARDVAGVGEPG